MIIRKATLGDAEFIAAYLLLAMKDIVYKVIGKNNPHEAREFMLHFIKKENNQYSFQNCWVAENENKVVAAINLYDGAKLHELRQPVLDYISLLYQRDLRPEDETQPGEYYIDTFGVSPNEQGKGIGTTVLRFIIDEYVNKQGCTLGLLVNIDNPDAGRFYLKLGFTSVGKKMLLGNKMEHLQIKGRKQTDHGGSQI